MSASRSELQREAMESRWITYARSKHLAGAELFDTRQKTALDHASMDFWTRVVRRRDPKVGGKALRVAFTLPERRHGSGSCGSAWGHCTYCDHGRCMAAAVRLLSRGWPTHSVTFRGPVGMSLSEVSRATYDCLSLFKLASPRSFLKYAQLIPSDESQSTGVNKRHVHATLTSTVSWKALDGVASLLELKTSHAPISTHPIGIGGWLGYCYEQMVATAVSDKSFNPHHRRVRDWQPRRTRFPTTILRAADRAVREGYEADSERLRNGSCQREPQGRDPACEQRSQTSGPDPSTSLVHVPSGATRKY